MTDGEAQLLSICPLCSHSWLGMGLVFTLLNLNPAYIRQIRCNEVFSMEKIFLHICLGKLFSLDLQFLGLIL